MRAALTALALLAPAVALASESPGAPAGGDQSMILLLTLLGIISASYLLTHFVVDRLQRRFLFVSGAEYILLGLLLGPQTNVLSDIGSISPILAFAAGWVGLLYGMELDLRRLFAGGDHATRLSLMDSLLTAGGVTVAGYLFFSEGLGLADGESWLAGSAMGCAAAAGSSSAVDLLIARYRSAEEGLLSVLRRAARMSDVLAILGLGLVMCIFHRGDTLTDSVPTTSDWVLFTAALGLSLGWLFAAFLGDDTSENSRFLALVGIIAFASGAAFFLNLSVLTVNLLLGMVLANTRQGREIHATLTGTIKPLSLVLLVVAGLLWEPVPLLPALAAGVGYIVLRAICKALGCWLASLGTSLRHDLFRGMMAQGHVALAIILLVRLVYDGDAVKLAYTAVLASVMLNELIAPRLLKGLLVDAGDVRQDVSMGREAL